MRYGKWILALAYAVPVLGCAQDEDALVRDEGAPPVNIEHRTPDPDQVYTFEYDVPVGPAREVHLVEKLTAKGLWQMDRRAILLLPGTLVKSSFYELDVDGYRFQSDLAKAGFLAFAIDDEGSGASTGPSDGHAVTHQFLVDEGRRLLDAVRVLGGVARVDVLGESNGGAVASELCDDAWRTRTCVMASTLYRTGTSLFYSVFLDPAFLAFIDGQPNGYFQDTSSLYFNITVGLPDAVKAAILATQPGRYAVGPLLAPAHGLPWFDPTRARVPGLVIQGTEDDVATQADAEDLRASYGSAGGGKAELVRITGAGQIPRIDAPPSNQTFQRAVLDFLASH